MSNPTGIKTPYNGGIDSPDSVIDYAFLSANTAVQGGRLAWSINSTGYFTTSTYALANPASVRVWGVYDQTIDNTTGNPSGNNGLDGGAVARYLRGVFLCQGSGITQADLGAPVFLVSDDYATNNGLVTVATSDLGGTRPLVGYVTTNPRGATDDPNAGLIPIRVAQLRPDTADPELVAAVQFKARNVATNLAALTFTGGAFLANANGALGAQDNVTNVAGDIIMIPAGTITTGVVSAANSGPWVLTSVGGAGKFSGIRPDWWPHAGTVTPGAVIAIGGEGALFGGTAWPTFAAATVVIGTGDPALYPRQVTQQVTLSSGTKTISNVPIFATARLGLAVALVGGTPDATTTAINFRITSGRTAGGIGTAAAIIDAQATLGGTKVAGDVSVVNVTLING